MNNPVIPTKPKIVTLQTLDGYEIILQNAHGVTICTHGVSGSATLTQSRQVFNQVINTLTSCLGYKIISVNFIE